MSDAPASTPSPTRPASGWGLASVHTTGQVLDSYFPNPLLDADPGAPPAELAAAVGEDALRQVTTELVRVVVDLDSPPADTPDAYLRLHLLSHRLVRPRSINLDGIFGVLPNVVWTSAGPCAAEGFETVRTRLRGARGQVTVFGIDKFPRMVDYVLPSGVR